MDRLARLDLAFCVDLTGSMGSFIAAARTQIVQILDALRAELGDGLRVAIVGYRDHCDGKKVVEVHPFTTKIATTKATVDKLEISGGGDAPEAVYSGLSACLELPWEEGAYRVVVLVGDAPPHGVGAGGDHYARGDPTGLDLDEVANRFETAGVFVHALAMTRGGDTVLEKSFRRLSISTGGSYNDAASGDAAMEIVARFADRFLKDIAFDRRLFDSLDDAPPDAEALAKKLKVTPEEVNAALMRLRQRKLIE
jgi:hypothetical protein